MFPEYPQFLGSLTINSPAVVYGVTQLNGKLFVVLGWTSTIHVYDVSRLPFQRLPDIDFPSLKWPRDLASCAETKQLLVSDRYWQTRGVWRVEVNESTSKDTFCLIRTHCNPSKISVTSQKTLIVTPFRYASSAPHSIYVYDIASGQLTQTIVLPDFAYPIHAVVTDKGKLVLYHRGVASNQHDMQQLGSTRGYCVSEFDQTGSFIRQNSRKLKFSERGYMSVNKASGNIYIAGTDDGRIVAMDATFAPHDIKINTVGDLKPYRINTDDSRFVVEFADRCFRNSQGGTVICVYCILN